MAIKFFICLCFQCPLDVGFLMIERLEAENREKAVITSSPSVRDLRDDIGDHVGVAIDQNDIGSQGEAGIR